tara:strand:- start:310 stop:1170 length:861 start_codon:yes stop_codon:yes gene_type:complete
MHVIGMGRSSSSLIGDEAIYIQINPVDAAAVHSIFKEFKITHVFHMAGVTEHIPLVDNAIRSMWDNLNMTRNILEGFQNSLSPHWFFFPSSGKVYSPMTGRGIAEDHSTQPSSILGKNKLIQERLIDFYATQSDKTYVIGRTFNIYGPYQRSTFLIPTALQQVSIGDDLYLGNVTDRRDYLYIDDFVDAALSARCLNSPGISVVNIGSGQSNNAAEIVTEIGSCIGRNLKIHIDKNKLRIGETSNEFGLCDTLHSLGWVPKFRLSKGIEKTIRHFDMSNGDWKHRE